MMMIMSFRLIEMSLKKRILCPFLSKFRSGDLLNRLPQRLGLILKSSNPKRVPQKEQSKLMPKKAKDAKKQSFSMLSVGYWQVTERNMLLYEGKTASMTLVLHDNSVPSDTFMTVWWGYGHFNDMEC